MEARRVTRTKEDTAPPVLHRGVGNWVRCKSCGARITFATTATGKLGPFELHPEGQFVLENGKARFVGKGALQLDLGAAPVDHYTSHFSTCPQRDEWRKPK